MREVQSSTRAPEQVIEIAGNQRFLIWLILLQIVSMLLMVPVAIGSGAGNSASDTAGVIALVIVLARIVIAGLSILGVYGLAKSLRKPVAFLYALATLLPLIGLLVLLVLNSEATKLLQENGVRVGLMGANAADIDRLKSEVAAKPNAPTAEQLAYCASCGQKLPDGAQYCPTCSPENVQP